jgi:lipid-A-disaccharide synthase
VSRRIVLVAAEASGDALGAEVIRALKAREPDVEISVIGGGTMSASAPSLPVRLDGLAVLGLVDGVMAFSRVKRLVREAALAIAEVEPDAVVLIDSWGFMWRLARELKLAGVKARRIKLIGPQVWATRPGRARVLAKWCDHLLCIHAFEQPYFERYGLPTTVIGNPALGRGGAGDGQAFCQAHGFRAGRRVLGLLPGSRRSELRRTAPILVEACARIHNRHGDVMVVCVAAPSVEAEVRAMAQTWTFPHILVTEEEDKTSAFAAMEVALACSGTVTTELAGQGAAIVVGYKVGWITWAIARLFLMRSRFITLLNVAAGEEAAPEFVQTRFTPDRVAGAALRLLEDPAALDAQRARQKRALEAMDGPGRPAADIAAETILQLTGR